MGPLTGKSDSFNSYSTDSATQAKKRQSGETDEHVTLLTKLPLQSESGTICENPHNLKIINALRSLFSDTETDPNRRQDEDRDAILHSFNNALECGYGKAFLELDFVKEYVGQHFKSLSALLYDRGDIVLKKDEDGTSFSIGDIPSSEFSSLRAKQFVTNSGWDLPNSLVDLIVAKTGGKRPRCDENQIASDIELFNGSSLQGKESFLQTLKSDKNGPLHLRQMIDQAGKNRIRLDFTGVKGFLEAVDLLRRGGNELNPNWDGVILKDQDLDHAYLRNHSLKRADLTNAILHYGRLQGTNFEHAILAETDLKRACCDGAIFRHTNLRTAKLEQASLENADLQSADLSGQDLRTVNLIGADFRGAILFRANLEEKVLRSVKLAGADLRGANLRRADLQGVDLRGADLRGANLRGANLRGVDLTGKDLTDTDLTGADLTDAILDGVTLKNTKLSGADLTSAKLRNISELRLSELTGATLIATEFSGTKLIGTNNRDMGKLVFTNLAGATLEDMDMRMGNWSLSDRDARQIDLSGATLINVKFDTPNSCRSWNLAGAKCHNVRFDSCLLIKCNFERAQFENTKFINTTLRNTNLSHINDLTGCTFDKDSKFDNVDVTGTNFRRANLSAVKSMKDVNLRAASRVRGMQYTSNTLAELPWRTRWYVRCANFLSRFF